MTDCLSVHRVRTDCLSVPRARTDCLSVHRVRTDCLQLSGLHPQNNVNSLTNQATGRRNASVILRLFITIITGI